MKRLLTFSIALITFVIAITPVVAIAFDSTIITIYVEKQPKKDLPDNPELPIAGHRTPSRPLPMTVSQESGVIIPGIDNADIVSFAIYDENEMPLASFTDESEFVTRLMSLTGTYMVEIQLSDYSLRGVIDL